MVYLELAFVAVLIILNGLLAMSELAIVSSRSARLKMLADRGIKVGIHYPWPIHTMPAYAHPDYPAGSLPVTEQAAREIFSLPIYPALTDADQDEVCRALLEAVSKPHSVA